MLFQTEQERLWTTLYSKNLGCRDRENMDEKWREERN